MAKSTVQAEKSPLRGQTSRAQLIADLNAAVQRQGALTVLFTHAIASRIGLSATEFEFCDALQHEGPLTAGQAAKLCGLSTGGVTGLVDRLERAGLVRRAPDPADRRRVVIQPIERGDLNTTIRHLYDPLSQAFAQVIDHYTDAELAIVLDFITRTTAMTEQVRSNLQPL